MKIEAEASQYHERPDVRTLWNFEELVHLRAILRRLRFLEKNIKEHAEVQDESPAALYTQREAAALKWLLDDIGYLEVRN